jgi:hypothetical protein
MTSDQKNESRTWSETIEVAGGELVDRVKELLRQGNVRRLIIRKPNNAVLLEVPLTAGVAVGAVATIYTPLLVALGAMAALLAKFKVEIVRIKDSDDSGASTGS